MSIFDQLNPNDPSAPQDNSFDPSKFPAYLGAADNHNLGNQGNSWFSDVTGSIENAPKFFLAAGISGINSFYNSGVKIGNAFGGDFATQDTQAVISNIDGDLGQYYSKNKNSVDMAGFMMTSLIPGLGGIKVLNAGQKALAAAGETGLLGSNLGLALGLRATQIDSYVSAAATEITQGQAIFSSIGTSGVKALAAGVYQNVLEGVAFETAVQATMNASPILDGQSKSDILKNVMMGGLFNGVLGGALGSAKIYGDITKQAGAKFKDILPHGSRDMMVEMNVPANKIIRNAYDLETGPIVNPGDPVYAQQVAALEQKQVRTALAMRADTNELVLGKDTVLARQIADSNVGISADEVAQKLIDTDEIGRLNTPTKVESELNAAAKDAISKGVPAEIDPALQVQYWKLHGENAGDVIDSAPRVMNLADVVKISDKVDSRAAVMNEVRSEGFSLKKLFDPAALSLESDAGHLTAEKRFLWADKILEEIPEGTNIHMNDIPLLQKAVATGQKDINIVDSTGQTLKTGFTSIQELKNFTINAQKSVQDSLQETALAKGSRFLGTGDAKEMQDWVNEKIGKITNTRVSALEGTAVSKNLDYDYDAISSHQADYNAYITGKGLRPVSDEENDIRFMPSWAKVTKRVVNRTQPNGHEIDAYTFIKGIEKVQEGVVDNVVAKQAGKFAEQLPRLTQDDAMTASIKGAGPGFTSFSAGKLGQLDSKMEQIGSVTQRMAQANKDEMAKVMEGPLANMARKQESVIEWGGINQKVSRSAKFFVQGTEDTIPEFEGRGLVSREIWDDSGNLKNEFATMSAKELEDEGLFIPVEHDETWDMINAHMDKTFDYTQNANERAAAMGKTLSRDPAVFRPIPPDVNGSKFIAFVKDPKVTGQGHTSMIFGTDAKNLEDLVNKAAAARPDLEIHYKQDTEEFRKARDMFQYDKTLSENYIDSSLKNAGVYSNYFIKTDPQAVINDILKYHTSKIDNDVREIVRLKNQPMFDWLEDQGKAYSRIETSKLGGGTKELERTGQNPFTSYIKVALNVSRTSESPIWYGMNKFLDDAVSNAVGKVTDLWDNIKAAPTDADMTAINASLQKYGMNTGYYDAATQLLVNHTAPANQLSKFIRGANAVLSRLVLGTDPLNSLNNAIGANILRGTELNQILGAIKGGDTELAGKLANLAKVDVTGEGDFVLSQGKLIRNAMSDFISDFKNDRTQMQWFKDNGFHRDLSDQFQAMLGDLSLEGTESVGALQSRLSSAIQKSKTLAEASEKFSGNKLAEEMNRFISAHCMKQLTDLAVDQGLMDSKEALSYINTFVNRVEGNTIASQRPFVFQGPIGQSIGLFQSYQFNLMQQMFRYVSEGSAKDAAMLMGLQGTFYGIAGLPAFQAINQHIIGTASGNKKHVDLYDATYGVAGKNLGDLLMYGIPSNILQTNLYSRGDINPRQVTILPTQLSEIPFVGATTKFYGAIKDTSSKIIQGGAVWESLLQGIEHNGVSRPLAGLAQVLQTTVVGSPMSTTSKGDILATNDLVSLATLSRLAGGRPLDEAIVNDGIFRIHSYQQYDNAEKQNLAESIKSTTVGAGNQPSSQQWSQFANEYAAIGGKQVQFNKFMIHQIKNSNTSEVQKITSQLQNPFAQKVQLLMNSGPQLSDLSSSS